MNILSPLETSLIWIPSVQFENIASDNDWTENKLRSSTYIVRNDTVGYKTADMGNLNNGFLYDSMNNELITMNEFTVKWICNYQMQWYPFDLQTCFMEFNLLHQYTGLAQLTPCSLAYRGPYNLVQYIVQHMTICCTDKGAVVVVKLGRPLLNKILTVFTPTIILLIFNQLGLMVEEIYFDLVMQLHMTVLLVLATL